MQPKSSSHILSHTSRVGPAWSWEKANLTIGLFFAKNCEDDVRSHICPIEDASGSWKVLQELYEEKPNTDHSSLLASQTEFSFDDHTSIINDHMNEVRTQYGQ
jgi:hypothetical protein